MEQNLLLPWPGAFGWDLLRESSCCPVRQPSPHNVCCYATNKKELEQWKRRKRRDLGETIEIPNHFHYSKLGNNLCMTLLCAYSTLLPVWGQKVNEESGLGLPAAGVSWSCRQWQAAVWRWRWVCGQCDPPGLRGKGWSGRREGGGNNEMMYTWGSTWRGEAAVTVCCKEEHLYSNSIL